MKKNLQSITPEDRPLLTWEQLLARQKAEGPTSLHTSARKKYIRRRLSLLDERYDSVIAESLAQTYSQPDVIARIGNHISKVVNIAKDVTRALACVYDQHPRRRLEGQSEAANKALLNLNAATGWRSLSKVVNQLAWNTGPVLEVPFASEDGKSIRREIVTGDCYDVVAPLDDPLGHPIAAAYHWRHGNEWVIKVIDAQSVRIFDTTGKLIKQWDHGVTDKDGAPMFPGTEHRYDCPTDIQDRWNYGRNERLTEATIEAGTVYTTMSWVRKNQNRKWLVLMGNLQSFDAPSGQDPEAMGFWDVDPRDRDPRAQVLDLNTPVSGFIEQIMFLYRQQIESFGIPQSALTFDFQANGTGGPASVTQLSLQHDQKTKLRNDQIVFALEHEKRSQYVLAAVAKQAGHPYAADLPAMPVFAESLDVHFPELTRIEDPKTKHAELDWKLKRGLITDAHIYQQSHPHLTLAEAKAEVLANLETQAEFNELKASRRSDPAAEMLDDNERTGAMRANPEPAPDPETETETETET